MGIVVGDRIAGTRTTLTVAGIEIGPQIVIAIVTTVVVQDEAPVQDIPHLHEGMRVDRLVIAPTQIDVITTGTVPLARMARTLDHRIPS